MIARSEDQEIVRYKQWKSCRVVSILEYLYDLRRYVAVEIFILVLRNPEVIVPAGAATSRDLDEQIRVDGGE